MKQSDIAVVMLNWNGLEDSLACLSALGAQTQPHKVIAVDNASADKFCEIIETEQKDVALLKNSQNLGFAGGVNTGIRYALTHNFAYVALINNDATPEPDWLAELVKTAEEYPQAGIVTGKLLKKDHTIDSTGDLYTSWGLAYPRGRGTADIAAQKHTEEVFGATGGASLYRSKMFEKIGLFDEDFFAYYEDVDISFRAQLAGWKVLYQPKAVAFHKIGASSSKIKGFTTYQTIKNVPWIFIKNVPLPLFPVILPRLIIAYWSIVFSSIAKGALMPVVKGLCVSSIKTPKKLLERSTIQRHKKVTARYIKSIITHDLPPNATKLRQLRVVLKKIRFWS